MLLQSKVIAKTRGWNRAPSLHRIDWNISQASEQVQDNDTEWNQTLRAEPNGFRVHLPSRSDTVSVFGVNESHSGCLRMSLGVPVVPVVLEA